MRTSNPATRQQILDTAAELFFRDGYHAVGIDTIVEEAGVAKMTLYRYFPSKDALIAAYLERVNEQFWAWFEEAIAPYGGNPQEQIVAFFRALVELVSSPQCYGCPFLNASAEFPTLDHLAHATALAHKQAVRERFRILAQQAKMQDPLALANQLLLLMDGAFLSVRMFGADNPGKDVAEAAQILLKHYSLTRD